MGVDYIVECSAADMNASFVASSGLSVPARLDDSRVIAQHATQFAATLTLSLALASASRHRLVEHTRPHTALDS